jgi:multiple sugar transport system substrate-binding protein
LNSRKIATFAALLALAAGAGCGKGGTEPAAAAVDNEPAELVVFGNPADPEEVFNARIGDAVRKKFPNYKITYLPKDSNTTMEKLIAAGAQVDLIYDSIGGAPGSLIQTGSQLDLTDLAKKYKIDLGRFDPAILEAVTQLGGLYGLPIHTGGLVLYYNKDIFDQFGVAYPKNGMTWDEAIEIGNRLTRNENGVQYIGLGLSIGHALNLNSYSLGYVDPKTEKAAINNDSFKKLVETIVLGPTRAPGYKEKIASINRTFNNNDFMKEKTMGMFVMNFGLQDQQDFQTFEWDMAPLPVFKDKPRVGTQPYPNILFVTSFSKYKDQAVRVLQYLTSDEYQMSLSVRGYAPVVKNKEIREAFNRETKFKDKNLANAMFYNQFASPSAKTRYDGAVSGPFNSQLVKLILGETDVNTALRVAEEEGNKNIEAQKNK